MEQIAFTAFASRTHLYNSGSVVVFDELVSNIGNAYQTSFNVVICPVSGLYAFFLSISSGLDETVTAHIITQSQGVMTSAQAYKLTRAQGTSSVITECRVGEMVWAELAEDDDFLGTLFGSRLEKVTSFSGYLIHAYDT